MSDKEVNPLLGVVAVILIFSTFMVILSGEPFPRSTGAHSEFVPTNPGTEIGGSVSKFLWDFRGFDLSFQTLILFTTAICCLALLREEFNK